MCLAKWRINFFEYVENEEKQNITNKLRWNSSNFQIIQNNVTIKNYVCIVLKDFYFFQDGVTIE